MSMARSLPFSEPQHPHLLSEVGEFGLPSQKAPPALTLCGSHYKALQYGRLACPIPDFSWSAAGS